MADIEIVNAQKDKEHDWYDLTSNNPQILNVDERHQNKTFHCNECGCIKNVKMFQTPYYHALGEEDFTNTTPDCTIKTF